jgi:hypothetical protein
MERLACNEVLGDLPFELDAMGAVLGHGFHPLKARQPRSIPKLQSVHRQGRTPGCGQTMIIGIAACPFLAGAGARTAALTRVAPVCSCLPLGCHSGGRRWYLALFMLKFENLAIDDSIGAIA